MWSLSMSMDSFIRGNDKIAIRWSVWVYGSRHRNGNSSPFWVLSQMMNPTVYYMDLSMSFNIFLSCSVTNYLVHGMVQYWNFRTWLESSVISLACSVSKTSPSVKSYRYLYFLKSSLILSRYFIINLSSLRYSRGLTIWYSNVAESLVAPYLFVKKYHLHLVKWLVKYLALFLFYEMFPWFRVSHIRWLQLALLILPEGLSGSLSENVL